MTDHIQERAEKAVQAIEKARYYSLQSRVENPEPPHDKGTPIVFGYEALVDSVAAAIREGVEEAEKELHQHYFDDEPDRDELKARVAELEKERDHERAERENEMLLRSKVHDQLQQAEARVAELERQMELAQKLKVVEVAAAQTRILALEGALRGAKKIIEEWPFHTGVREPLLVSLDLNKPKP